jgi:hypothetical protein
MEAPDATDEVDGSPEAIDLCLLLRKSMNRSIIVDFFRLMDAGFQKILLSRTIHESRGHS